MARLAPISSSTAALLSVLAVVGFAAIAGVAVLDHVHKGNAKRGAYTAEWFCSHRAVRCGGPSPAAIEDAWNSRERLYIAGLVLVGFAGIGVQVWRAASARKTGSTT